MEHTASTLTHFALPLGVVCAGLLLGLVVRRSILGRLSRAAAGTHWRGDDLIINALQGPVVVWFSMLGLYLATQLAPLPVTVMNILQRVLLVLLVGSVTWAVARLAGDAIGAQGRAADEAFHSPQLVTNLVRAIVLLLGALIVLQTLGVAITPLITALGVTGLAVGLALQDTLANLFAGIHILLSRQVRRGDFIRLSEGQEGVVQDITWRYTTITHLSNVTVTVPNSKLASAVTANYTLRGGNQVVLVAGSVGYDADLARVEASALAAARETIAASTGVATSFVPLFRFVAMDDTRIRFQVALGVADRNAVYGIRHEFIKQLRARFRADGIQ